MIAIRRSVDRGHAEHAPRYEQRAFPEAERRGSLRLVVSPDGRDGSLTIGQDARLFAGDGAAIRGERAITLANGRDAEVVLWELPAPADARP